MLKSFHGLILGVEVSLEMSADLILCLLEAVFGAEGRLLLPPYPGISFYRKGHHSVFG